uniref:Uncharacterized protein n=1 Tax=Neobodo designis TaxID=312471 RepID=A0A7S1MQ36_NEODS
MGCSSSTEAADQRRHAPNAISVFTPGDAVESPRGRRQTHTEEPAGPTTPETEADAATRFDAVIVGTRRTSHRGTRVPSSKRRISELVPLQRAESHASDGVAPPAPQHRSQRASAAALFTVPGAPETVSEGDEDEGGHPLRDDRAVAGRGPRGPSSLSASASSHRRRGSAGASLLSSVGAPLRRQHTTSMQPLASGSCLRRSASSARSSVRRGSPLSELEDAPHYLPSSACVDAGMLAGSSRHSSVRFASDE